MQLEEGLILEGKVTGITKFGAFVELPEGKTGMVHISEIAHTFVNEIRDHVQENQVVKVKVLGISDEGKISLSMKKAIEQPKNNRRQDGDRYPNRFNKAKESVNRPSNFDWNDHRKDPAPANFEDMLSKFKKASDEKMSDLKRVTESKRGGFSRRGNAQPK